MDRSKSLVARVARSAALGASAAALLAAVATSALGAFLLQQAEDRRLREAGMVLVMEIGDVPVSTERIVAIVRHEHEETKHAGIRFAVAAEDRSYIAGDELILRPRTGECTTDAADDVRTCSVSSVSRLIVTTASMHTPQTQLFLLAAIVAVAFSGLMTWLWSRPVARAAVAPLSRLRAQVAAIDVDTGAAEALGPSEDVSEVDELRATIGQLIARLARALDQAQRFAANAAHELRTPLTAVRAELDLLAEKPQASGDAADSLTTARTKVADLALLVEKLLILATPRGAVNAPAEIVSLRDMMEDVVRGLPPEQAKKVALSDEDALVRGDTVLLTTMFTNGLVNALKFGNVVGVSLQRQGSLIVITIDDDGPGLDEAILERVFEPFFRSQDALQRRVPGHGLGLALVRHVAESHGGSAHFGHKDTLGARLHIELPQLDG